MQQLNLPGAPPKSWTVLPAAEFKLMRLREVADDKPLCDTPERAYDYWCAHVADSPQFQTEVEQFVILLLNTRKRIIGHTFGATGTLDTLLVAPASIFRVAIVQNAAAVVFMHNHPSGDSCPSEADIKVTRDLIRAGQLLKIEVLDHVVVGDAKDGRPKAWTSLRELGYFY